MLGDIATLTGAKAVMEDLGVKVEALTLDDLGTAERIVITKDNTTVVGALYATDIKACATNSYADGRHPFRLRP